ncbi:VapB-type antitoxin [Sulfurisphaera ohwakuensis]|uniref:Prefoldin subunit 5 n=2 Tax=Sulfurisphaera ohwakuensis TaxID=69656 RepID=A0A7J9RYT5_SULOH|nr:VapB-type antitoxin [Sulfurisphaera ohwakuensis]MBB5254384.1 prefoldin subunit 5 [Sulfurisphaera ohwakuensis]
MHEKIYSTVIKYSYMIGQILIRNTDEKGRIVISEFKKKEVYLVDLGSGYFITDKKDLAEKVAEKASNAFEEEFLKTVEEMSIVPEEIDQIVNKEISRKVT